MDEQIVGMRENLVNPLAFLVGTCKPRLFRGKVFNLCRAQSQSRGMGTIEVAKRIPLHFRAWHSKLLPLHNFNLL
jgi:hypothetical protein